MSRNRYVDAIKDQMDPVRYVRRVSGIEPDPWQAEVLRSKARRIVINCARQVGKSTITGALLAYTAETYGGSLSLLIAPSLRQSLLLFEQVHGPLDESGVSTRKSTASEKRLGNGSKLVALPGNPKTVRGFGGVDLLVIDEAAYTPQSLFDAVMPMVMISQGRVILLSTPQAKQGMFWNAWNDEGYEKFHITSYDCPRIPAADIDHARGEYHTDLTASTHFKRDFLAEFTDPDDALVTESDIDALFSDPPKVMMSEDDDLVDPGVAPMLFAEGHHHG